MLPFSFTSPLFEDKRWPNVRCPWRVSVWWHLWLIRLTFHTEPPLEPIFNVSFVCYLPLKVFYFMIARPKQTFTCDSCRYIYVRQSCLPFPDATQLEEFSWSRPLLKNSTRVLNDFPSWWLYNEWQFWARWLGEITSGDWHIIIS